MEKTPKCKAGDDTRVRGAAEGRGKSRRQRAGLRDALGGLCVQLRFGHRLHEPQLQPAVMLSVALPACENRRHGRERMEIRAARKSDARAYPRPAKLRYLPTVLTRQVVAYGR